MEFQFDKEIDALLRRSRPDGTVPADVARAHPDADEIAAFAENAVPVASRSAYIAHFADCDRCRAILSNVILTGGEAAPIAEPPVPASPDQQTPWYRKLFLFPQIAYSMGALVLIFSAFFVYTLFRGTENASYISQATDRDRSPAKQANTIGSTSNTTSNSASVAQNTNAAPLTKTTANATPSATGKDPRSDGNLTAGTDPSEADDNAVRKEERAADAPETKPVAAGTVTDPALAKPTPARSQPTGGETAEKQVRDETLDKSRVNQEPLRTRSAPSVPKKDVPSDIRQVGRKTFRKTGATWTDAAYVSQPLTTVRRGSEEYRKLDAGLRSLAEQLSGPVIVVWKERGYRID
jgi:hypothetical protein